MCLKGEIAVQGDLTPNGMSSSRSSRDSDDDFLARARTSDSTEKTNLTTNVFAKEICQQLLTGGFLDKMLHTVRQQTTLALAELLPNTSERPTLKSNTIDDESARAFNRIQLFDPDQEGASVERWLRQIDSLGHAHKWSSRDRIYVMQKKLDGVAIKWFQRLSTVERTWVEWKRTLISAFPNRCGFGELIHKLGARFMKPDEKMTSYFQDKASLCSRAGIVGEKAVDCIIYGLPEEYRQSAYAAKCKTPEEFYNHFLADPSKPKLPEKPSVTEKKSHMEPTNRSRGIKRSPIKSKLVRCFNCQKKGTHLSKDCPESPMRACRQCASPSHIAKNCPKRSRFPVGKGDRSPVSKRHSRDDSWRRY